VSDEDDSTKSDSAKDDKAGQDDAATNSGDDDKDWQSEYEGAKKVNRDLERKGKRDLSRIQQLEKELAEARKGAEAKDGQPDPAELRKQLESEIRTEGLKERALDKVETKAAKLFADPEDARALLASQADDFVTDGKVDLEAIQEALDDLLKKKPHLAAERAKRFQGGADGGARKGSKPDQLTRDDLKKMSNQQIEKARQEGRLNELMGID
jgi:hypothetical protein